MSNVNGKRKAEFVTPPLPQPQLAKKCKQIPHSLVDSFEVRQNFNDHSSRQKTQQRPIGLYDDEIQDDVGINESGYAYGSDVPMPSQNTSAPPTEPVNTSWNDKFVKICEKPTNTPNERLSRAKEMHELYDQFVNMAIRLGTIIIEEVHKSEINKTIQQVPKGLAGGDKFIYNGIFFKLAKDTHDLYGGDTFAMKAVGHEIKGLSAVLECGIEGLFLPMMAVMDYYGYRIIAEAVLPLKDKETICYGSADACRTIHDSNAQLADLCQKVAKAVNLKRHMVGKGISLEPKYLYLPGDVEGHCGVDGRFYMVDLQRLFPAESQFKTVWGVIIPVDVTKRFEFVEIAKNREDGWPVTQAVAELLGKDVDWSRTRFPEVIVSSYSSTEENAPINTRATDFLSTTTRGRTLIIAGEKRQNLYCHLRGELVKRNKPIAVSSDVFMRFGEHDRATHEAEVTALTQKLRNEVIPEFASWLVANPSAVVSAFHLPALMHMHGINMRYLGKLYMLVPDTSARLKHNIIGFQMLARVIKGLLQAKLRTENVESKDQCKALIVDFFNLVLGKGKATEDFWEITMPIQLLLKYGPFGFAFNPGDNVNFQFILGHVSLFDMMQQYTGLKFCEDAAEKIANLQCEEGDDEGPTNDSGPLSVEDLLSIDVLVKRIDVRSQVLPYIEEVVASGEDADKEMLYSVSSRTDMLNVSVEKRIAMLHKHLELVQTCIGEKSEECGACVFKLADAFSIAGQHEKALGLAIQSFGILKGCNEVHGEILYGCVYLLGLIFERQNNDEAALGVYKVLLEKLQSLYDSLHDVNSASPFSTVLIRNILKLSQSSDNEQSEDDDDDIKALKERKVALQGVFGDKNINEHRLVLEFLSFRGLSGQKYTFSNVFDEEFLAQFM